MNQVIKNIIAQIIIKLRVLKLIKSGLYTPHESKLKQLKQQMKSENTHQFDFHQLDNQWVQNNSNSEMTKQFGLTDWQFYKQYSEFFKDIFIYQNDVNTLLADQQLFNQTKKNLIQILKKNNFFIIQNPHTNSFNQIKIKNLKRSSNYQITQIFCQLGQYAKQYTVLHQNYESFYHQNHILGIGSFGKVYSCKHQDKEVATKCLSYFKNDLNKLKDHVKQFFLYDVMSSLEIGPKVFRNKGFDFIIFENCLEFVVQKCYHIKNQQVIIDLKQNMVKMHILSIVHGDIKPVNIMYSKQFQKNVFLDYGTSQAIIQIIGQKSQVRFRGTYQFCGEQMKKIILNKEVTFIDLYFNDVEMLKNAFHSISLSKIIVKSYYFQQNIISLQNNTQNENQCRQILIKLKYHLYISQHLQIPTSQFLQFLEEFKNQVSDQQKIQVLVQAINFTYQLEQKALLHLKKQLVWKNQKFKQTLLFAESIKALNNQKFQLVNKSLVQNQKQSQRQKFSNFSNFQQMIKINFMNSSQAFLSQKNNAQKEQNIIFIFQNQSEMKKFQIEEIFQFFLKFSSFFKPQCSLPVQNKQKLAENLFKYIQTNNLVIEGAFVLQISLPISQFTKTQCKYLVLVYQYLLNHCLQKPINKFKKTYTLLILKNCMILGFQYFYFMKKTIEYYFCQLILQKNSMLIALISQQAKQLYFLTYEHFIQTNQQKPLYKEKFFEICLKQILVNLVEFFNLNISKSQIFYTKKYTLIVYWETFFNPLNNIDLDENSEISIKFQNAQKIFDQLEEQFKMNDPMQLASYFNSIRHFLYRRLQRLTQMKCNQKYHIAKHIDHKYPSQQNNVNLTISSNIKKQLKTSQLQYFDNQINCFQLSIKFYVEQRFTEAYKCSNLVILKKLWDLILDYNGCPSFNFPALTSIRTDTDLFSYGNISLSKHEGLLSKLNLFNIRFLDMFSQKQNQGHLHLSLIFLINLHGNNKGCLSQQKQQLLSKIQLLSNKHSQNFTFIAIKRLKFELIPQNSIQYLQNRRDFFLFYLKTFEKHKKLIDFFVVNYCSNGFAICYFNQIFLFKNKSNFHVLKYKFWKSYKIKKLLNKSKNQSLQFIFLNLSCEFIARKKTQYLIEILALFCKQLNLNLDSNFYRYFDDTMDQLSLHTQIKMDIASNFQSYLKKIKRFDLTPTYLIPLCIYTLIYYDQFGKQFHSWKKMLLQLFRLFKIFQQSISSKFNENIKTFALIYKEQLFFVSLKYHQKIIFCQTKNTSLSAMMRNYKRIANLMKTLIKNKVQTNFFYQHQISIRINKFKKLFQEGRYFQNINNRSTKLIKSLNIKTLKYIENSLFNIKMESQQSKTFLKLKSLKEAQLTKLIEMIPPNLGALQKYSELKSSHDLEIMQKYKIRDLTLFKQIKAQHLNIRLSQQVFCEQKIRIKNVQSEIIRIKSTRQYKICDQTIDIIHKYLELQKKVLIEQLQMETGLNEKDIEKKSIFQLM